MILYLDIDGVLNPYPRMGKSSDFSDFQNHIIQVEELRKRKPHTAKYTLRLSREMSEALFNLGIEIVWNSTWCDHLDGLKEIASILGLEHCRALQLDPPDKDIQDRHSFGKHYNSQKLIKMLEDVDTHQLPFIWCDDESINLVARSRLKKKEGLPPYSLIIPKSKFGLTSSEINMMRRFIRSQS